MSILDKIVSARIHPAIGIARVGNSESEKGWFDGPELPYAVEREKNFSFRDGEGKLKRQAARFRIYGYDSHGHVVGEITAEHADIQWTVHVANKKAAWYEFMAVLDLPEAAAIQSARRNGQIRGENRKRLVIDPGEASISSADTEPVPLVGKFLDYPVDLGELRIDGEGRLRFLGGHGKSGTPLPHFDPPTNFGNNPGWHDDVSDGPVRAQVTFRRNGREIPVEPAWVVTAPPNYAPDLIASQTLYDVIRDACKGFFRQPAPGETPRPVSFSQEILPHFQHFQDAQWLNFGFFAMFGANGMIDFTRKDIVRSLADKSDSFKELRRLVLNSFRDPNATDFQPAKWPPIFGDAFGNFESPPTARVGLAITGTMFKALQQWAAGNFIDDYDPAAELPQVLEDVKPVEKQPALLDRAALTFCMGGPFHPGCELTWPMRRSSMYRAPFRLRQRSTIDDTDYGEFLTSTIALSRDGPLACSGPGDLTRWMAVPWQTDTVSCRGGFPRDGEFPNDPFLPSFWPSRVPNHVLTEANFCKILTSADPDVRQQAFRERADWLRHLNPDGPAVDLMRRMVDEFARLGIVERRELPESIGGLPDVMYVETLPRDVEDEPARVYPVTEQFLETRFGHLREGRGR